MTDDPTDIDLDRDRSIPENVGAPAPQRRRPAALIIVLVLVLALVGAYIYLRRPPSEAPSAGAKPATPPAARQGVKGDTIVLPPLDETDPLIRELVRRLSSHPTVAAW